MTGLYHSFARAMDAIPYAIIALIARFAGSIDFWRSGQSKLDGGELFGVKFNIFDVVDKKVYLFENVYGIPAPLAPAMTHAAALAEFFFPIMLVLGFLSRFAALGLLAMTVFIQFYVFPEELLNPNGNWSTHLLWTAPLLIVLARGSGAISLDALFGRGRR